MAETSRPETHRVDAYVGERLRALRKFRRMSQTALADQLGITFQQIQKYERGANRISASKLFEAAETLDVDVATFFEGLSTKAAAGAMPDPLALLFNGSPDVAQAVRLLAHLPKTQQALVVGLIAAINAPPPSRAATRSGEPAELLLDHS